MTIYNCIDCNFCSNLKANYNRHLKTKKHLNNVKSIANDHNTVNTNVNTVNTNVNTVNKREDTVNTNVNTVNEKEHYHNFSVNTSDSEIYKKTYNCKYCLKYFTSRQSKYQHQKRCKNKIIDNNFNDYETNNSKIFQEKVHKQIKEKDKQIEQLKNMVEVLLNNNKPTHITNQKVEGNNTTNINQYIILNAFGKEKTDYIKPDEIQRLIDHEPMNYVPKLLKEIHFNIDHNENHNIYIPNKKEAYAKIYDGDNWILRKKNEAIEDMAHRAFSMILKNDNINLTQPINQIKDNYSEEDKKTVARINSDTEMMILNNQPIINRPKK